MKTVKSSGVTFKVVNELPTPVRNRLLKSVNEFVTAGLDFDPVDNILNYIAGGACGRVYDLGEGYILKVNKFDWMDNTPDGDILNDLQGIPMIPKLYWYSEDNRFVVVQKIEGVVTGKYTGQFDFKREWNEEFLKKLAHEVDRAIQERGWKMNDIHSHNCMVDYDGNFWIVDVGLFRRKDEMLYSELKDLLGEIEDVAFYQWRRKLAKLA